MRKNEFVELNINGKAKYLEEMSGIKFNDEIFNFVENTFNANNFYEIISNKILESSMNKNIQNLMTIEVALILASINKSSPRNDEKVMECLNLTSVIYDSDFLKNKKNRKSYIENLFKITTLILEINEN